MDSEGCPFSSLPQDFCHSFLQQAFKQLDQRHLCGIAPLVCRPWHTLAVSCSSSLDVKVQTKAAGESLNIWVQKNGSNVQHLSLSYARALYISSPLSERFFAISNLTQLKSLDLSYSMSYISGLEIGTLMASLPQLKVLRLEDVLVFADTLTQLRPLLKVPTIALVINSQEGAAGAAKAWLQRSGGSLEVLKILPGMRHFGGAQLLPLLTPLQPLLAPKLRSLTLFDCELVQCAAIASLTQLTGLTLRMCSLADGDLVKLSALSGLRKLDIESMEDFSPSQESWKCLAKSLVQLRELIIDLDQIGSAMAAAQGAFKERVVTSDWRSLTLRPSQ